MTIRAYEGVDVYLRNDGFYAEHFRSLPSDEMAVVLEKRGPFDTRIEAESAVREIWREHERG